MSHHVIDSPFLLEVEDWNQQAKLMVSPKKTHKIVRGWVLSVFGAIFKNDIVMVMRFALD